MNVLILFENSLTGKELKLAEELDAEMVILGTSAKRKIQVRNIDIEKFCLKGLKRVISEDMYSESFAESILFLFLRDADKKFTRIFIRNGTNAEKYNLSMSTIKSILEKSGFSVKII